MEPGMLCIWQRRAHGAYSQEGRGTAVEEDEDFDSESRAGILGRLYTYMTTLF